MRLINFLKETLNFRTEIKPNIHKSYLPGDIQWEFSIGKDIGIFSAVFNENNKSATIAYEVLQRDEKMPKNLSRKEQFDGQVKRLSFNPLEPTGYNSTAMSKVYGSIIGCVEKLLDKYKTINTISGTSMHEKLTKFYSSSAFKNQIRKIFPNWTLEQEGNSGTMFKNS